MESLNVLRGQRTTRQGFAFVFTDPNNTSVSTNFDVASEKLPELKVVSKELLTNLSARGLTKDEILAIFAQACNETINT